MRCESASVIFPNDQATVRRLFGPPLPEDSDDPEDAPDAGSAPKTGQPPSILIVEDEGLVALSISQTLSDAGYGVVGIAASADAALRAAESHPPDLVLMDIALRGRKDGIEAAQMLRNRHRHDLRILFVTAHGDPQTRSRAQSVDPAGFLIKPYDSAQLLKAVREALADRR